MPHVASVVAVTVVFPSTENEVAHSATDAVCPPFKSHPTLPHTMAFVGPVVSARSDKSSLNPKKETAPELVNACSSCTPSRRRAPAVGAISTIVTASSVKYNYETATHTLVTVEPPAGATACAAKNRPEKVA